MGLFKRKRRGKKKVVTAMNQTAKNQIAIEVKEETEEVKKEAPVFLRDRLDHYLTTNTAELTDKTEPFTLNAECVCAAVGKEAYAAEKEKG